MRLLILLVKGGHCVGDCLTVWKMGTSRWTSTCIRRSRSSWEISRSFL